MADRPPDGDPFEDLRAAPTGVRVFILAAFVAGYLLLSAVAEAAVTGVSPADGSTLYATSGTWQWDDTADEYWFYVGTGVGANDTYTSGDNGGAFDTPMVTVTGLPADSSQLFIRVWDRAAGGQWDFTDSVVTAWDGTSTDPDAGGGTGGDSGGGASGVVELSTQDRELLASIDTTLDWALQIGFAAAMWGSVWAGWSLGSRVV